ncbi:hypothetical protein B0F90DRAFT_1820666 [Multifurca ochricompacta]|uniref:Uncharacterized protein n=1 Tax=Multifurca ochricompacta TaxID=376703 RepID=A0AAD4LYL5_9AGAM|nr:hypothetical protein B0F90DRAFT_1820666 [Multifurca ochricompacta]
MSTPSSSPPSPPTSSFSPGPAPSNSGSTPGILGPGNNPPTSLYLYTFVATLSLLFVIFGILVARSVRLRRRRNAAVLAAIAAGTYVPPSTRNGRKLDGPLAPKPVLWEAHLSSPLPLDVSHVEKGWADIFPIAGATLVPDATPTPNTPDDNLTSWSRSTSWRSRLRRISSLISGTGRRPSNPPLTPALNDPPALPLSPALPSAPVHLAVLISMPVPPPRGTLHRSNSGPPIVEFGVTHVAQA